jgi:RimJ/RimL family protein N-acetyltransferase
MWIVPVTLEGHVVRLEPCTPAHAAGLLAAASPEIFRFTPQAPKEWSVEGFTAQIEKINALSDVVAFAIVHLPSNRVIGRTTFMDIQPHHRGVEIGRTWIARNHQGTSVNPEMKYLMMRHAFEERDAVRVCYKTGLTNVHSQRAIAKLGAVREGVLRNHMILSDGSFRDTVVFSLTHNEWPDVQQRL